VSLIDFLLAIQTSTGPDSETTSNSAAAGYFVIGLIAVAVGFIVLMMIRSTPRKTKG
jgi:hypothetical protein